MINLKALIEKREALIGEMEQLVEKAKTETRGMSIEENARFDTIVVILLGTLGMQTHISRIVGIEAIIHTCLNITQ